MKVKFFLRFIEICDDEGETWNMFVENTPENQKGIQDLSLLSKINKDLEYTADNYYFEKNDVEEFVLYTEEEVSILLEENDGERTLYLEEFKIGEIKELDVKVEGLSEDDLMELIDSQLYKQQCFNTFKK